MPRVDGRKYPLERLISIKSRVTYVLPVRTEKGDVMQLMCEFQTPFDYVFSADEEDFMALGQKVSVRSNTLRGSVWQTCQVTVIEEHENYSLFQLTIMPKVTANAEQRNVRAKEF